MQHQTLHNSAIKKSNGDWAKSDTEIADTFASHPDEVFSPFPRDPSISAIEEEHITNLVRYPETELEPITRVNCIQIQEIIKGLKLNKSPGYDLLTSKILKELPSLGIKYLVYIFNAVLRLHYFPLQWKVAQVVLILKPGKAPQSANSYRPISLLPLLSKVMEIIILKRLDHIIQEKNIIPDHQFGFRKQHSTVEQVNRVYSIARSALEKGQYCTAVFIDVSQAFDKVWHPGLLYKLKEIFPLNLWSLLYSYLKDRHFMVKYKSCSTKLHNISSGVPQGSVLGPVLYTLYTHDLPQSDFTYTATYADDTVVLSSHEDKSTASYYLQQNLREIELWLKKMAD